MMNILVQLKQNSLPLLCLLLLTPTFPLHADDAPDAPAAAITSDTTIAGEPTDPSATGDLGVEGIAGLAALGGAALIGGGAAAWRSTRKNTSSIKQVADEPEHIEQQVEASQAVVTNNPLLKATLPQPTAEQPSSSVAVPAQAETSPEPQAVSVRNPLQNARVPQAAQAPAAASLKTAPSPEAAALEVRTPLQTAQAGTAAPTPAQQSTEIPGSPQPASASQAPATAVGAQLAAVEKKIANLQRPHDDVADATHVVDALQKHIEAGGRVDTAGLTALAQKIDPASAKETPDPDALHEQFAHAVHVHQQAAELTALTQQKTVLEEAQAKEQSLRAQINDTEKALKKDGLSPEETERLTGELKKHQQELATTQKAAQSKVDALKKGKHLTLSPAAGAALMTERQRLAAQKKSVSHNPHEILMAGETAHPDPVARASGADEASNRLTRQASSIATARSGKGIMLENPMRNASVTIPTAANKNPAARLQGTQGPSAAPEPAIDSSPRGSVKDRAALFGGTSVPNPAASVPGKFVSPQPWTNTAGSVGSKKSASPSRLINSLETNGLKAKSPLLKTGQESRDRAAKTPLFQTTQGADAARSGPQPQLGGRKTPRATLKAAVRKVQAMRNKPHS